MEMGAEVESEWRRPSGDRCAGGGGGDGPWWYLGGTSVEVEAEVVRWRYRYRWLQVGKVGGWRQSGVELVR